MATKYIVVHWIDGKYCLRPKELCGDKTLENLKFLGWRIVSKDALKDSLIHKAFDGTKEGKQAAIEAAKKEGLKAVTTTAIANAAKKKFTQA